MKTITLTMNEALVLIAEGMTMNNVKTLANKLRNADAPVAAISTEKYDLEKAKAQSKTWEQSYHDAMVNLDVAKQNLKLANQQVYDYERDLEKAKQTESTLRADILKLSEACAHVNQENYEQTERANRMESKIRDLENDAKQDDESLKYFRKWVEELRVATDADKGLTTAAVFSQAVQMIKESNRLGDRVVDLESKLNKANDVIGAVKAIYDSNRDYAEITVDNIKVHVEAYYRGN